MVRNWHYEQRSSATQRDPRAEYRRVYGKLVDHWNGSGVYGRVKFSGARSFRPTRRESIR
jgi:hypothetical protein